MAAASHPTPRGTGPRRPLFVFVAFALLLAAGFAVATTPALATVGAAAPPLEPTQPERTQAEPIRSAGSINSTVSEIIDLSVQKRVAVDHAGPGEQLAYTITVQNLARIAASNVKVTDTLPSDARLVAASPGCSPAHGQLVCSLGGVLGGTTREITLTVLTPAAIGPMTNAVAVGSSDTDPDPRNNIAQVTVRVQERPRRVVDGPVDSYAAGGPKVFWHMPPICMEAGGEAPTATAETLGRAATRGSPTRQLRLEPKTCGDPLTVRSNLIADEGYVYYMGAGGLKRLPVTANPGEPDESLSGAFGGQASIAGDGTFIYALVQSPAGPAEMWKVRKSDGAADHLGTAAAGSRNLQTDGQSLFWLAGSDLRGFNLAGGAHSLLASNVNDFYAGSSPDDGLFFATGNQVQRRNKATGATLALYTGADPGLDVYDITGDNRFLVFLEEDDGLTVRLHRADHAGANRVVINEFSAAWSRQAEAVSLIDAYVYWKQAGLVEVHVDPSVFLPNLSIVDWGPTQGVQDKWNTVALIRNRITYLRMFVVTDKTQPVPGVTAHLYVTWDGGQGGPLEPVNPAGTSLTILPTYDETAMDGGFLFAIPLSWMDKSRVRFKMVVNPYNSVEEWNYDDNTYETSWINLNASARLEAQFVAFEYEVDGVHYLPDRIEDVNQTYSYIRRLYPLSSSIGNNTVATPGFRPRGVWEVFDDQLGSHITHESDLCQTTYANYPSLIAYCASYYTNGVLWNWRTEYGVEPNIFLYGLIQMGGWGVGGQANGDKTSSGLSGEHWAWDADSTDADWYAAHEIGHTLGRAHPVKGSACGSSADDQNYPYTDGHIGPGDGSVLGFDVGAPAYGVQRAVHPDWLWTDMMTYCDYEWISDHTYKCLYQALTTGAVTGNCKATALEDLNRRVGTQGEGIYVPGVRQAGDWLRVFGMIDTTHNEAHFLEVRRADAMAIVPPLIPGPYRIQLQDGAGTVLADHAFTAKSSQDGLPGQLDFGEVVAFADGTARVRIVDNAGAEMGSHVVSANAPSVTNVQVSGPDPAGLLNVTWTAADPDPGDVLSFEVLHSRNDGVWRQLAKNLSAQSVQVDSSELAGGPALLRVVATDGSQSGWGESGVIILPNKPPFPLITSPGAAQVYQWGQLVSLLGEAADAQDGGIAPEGLIWTGNTGPLGAGSSLDLMDLPVGVNWITLTVTNSVGLKASTAVSITVVDDLDLPGPTLSVSPPVAGWHVAAGSTTVVTAPVTILNTGSGVMTWTVSSSAGWLQPGQLSGQGSAQIVVSGDPAGMAENATATAALTIHATGGGDEMTAVIPFTLSTGNVWTAPAPKRHLWLPLTKR